MYKVYRYENPKDNCGPYTCTMLGIDFTVCEAVSKNHMGREDKPSAREDGLDFIVGSDDFRIGCDSLEMLKKWFKGYNKWLIKSGFVLTEYTVSTKVDSISKLQCAFHKSSIIERKEIGFS